MAKMLMNDASTQPVLLKKSFANLSKSMTLDKNQEEEM